MKEIRNDNYGLYNDKLYRISIVHNDSVRLCSNYPSDVNNGFICNDSEYVIKKYGFVCIKEVSKSEITEAYEIRTHAVYKGVGATIIGSSKENHIGLRTCCLDGENKADFLRKVNNAEFEYCEREQGGYDIYGKDVSLDDPDLQLIEKRTEIDINKL